MFEKMEQFCKQHHFSKPQLKKITPHNFRPAFDTQFWGMGRCFLEALLALLLLDIDCGNAAQRKRVLPQGIAQDA